MKYRILLASPLLFTVAFAAFAAFAFNPFGSTSKSIASQPASISAQPGSNRISKLKTPNNSQTPRGLNQGHVPPVESQGSVLKQQEAGGDRIPPTIIHRTRRDDDETSELYTGFATTSQGVGSLSYHQGPLMLGTTKMYYIWYGNWANNTATTILTDLATNIGGSPYFNINTVYTDVNGTAVSNSVQYGGAITDNYSQGQGTLSDTAIFNIVNSAISSGRLPMDPNAVYFVLTSSDLGQGDSSSSFGKDYCGWHTYATVNNGPSIKYAFIGNPENTPTCTAQSTSSPNGNIGADGMASIIAHELEESVTDPEITAWYGVDAKNNLWENADQCAWTFGSGVYTAANGSKANVKLGNRDFLIQQNWTNTNGCVMSLSGSSTTTTATLTVSSTNPTSGVNITVSPKDNNGAGNGATQFSRTYNVNTNVTLTASASAGSNNFQKWQRDGVDLSTSPQVTVAMDTNHAMTAVYQAAQGYSIGVTASPSSGGTVSGGGTFAAGSSVTVAATASAGYTFSTWTENGNAVVAQNNYTFTVSGSRNLVANFIPTSQARAQMTSPAAGSTFGSGTVTFNWSQVANSTQYSLYVGNAYRSYDIYASYVSGGSTTVSGIPTDGRTIYISLWSFINGIWVPADYTYQAETPTSQGYAINLIASPSAGGTVSGGGTVAPGTSRTVTATANAGYTFSTWSENGNAIVAQNSYMFTVTGNRNLVANFISNSQARAQITSPTGGSTFGSGTVTFNWTQVSNSTQYSLYVGNSYRAYDIYSNYVSGGTTTVSGIPTDGRTIYVSLWSFINGVWVPADYTYKAETPTTQGSTITVSASPSAGGTVSGGGTFAAGSSVTVTATASAGYTFSTWTENGNAVVAQNNYTFTVSGSRNLVANFIPNSQARAQMTSPAAGSTFSSGTVTFNWSQVSNSTQYSLYVGNSYRGYDIYSNYVSGGSTVVSGIPTDGRTIYVSLWSFINGIWVPADYTYHSGTSTTQGFAITASASPSAGGTVSGGGTFGAGTSVTLTATANAGYTFSTWTENGNAIVAQNNYTFTVSGSRNLVAYFISNSQPRAQLTNLANGATFNSSTMTFTWTPVSNATQYSLYVGNSYRGYDIYSNYVSGGTTAVSGIPTDGRTIYVSLWSFINGIWVPADYSFHACSGCK